MVEASKTPLSDQAAAQGLEIAKAALWDIAGFALQCGHAPEVNDYDDAESAYDAGENVALWDDGMKALKALAQIGDARASEVYDANRELEDLRDAEADQ